MTSDVFRLQNLVFLTVAIAAAGCSPDVAPPESQGSTDVETAASAVVYGEDDRLDWYAHPDEQLRELTTESIVALIPSGAIDESDPTNIRLDDSTLGEGRNLCEGELFADQPTAANCSGTLIAADLVMTAGHCVDDRNSCRSYRYVFDYYYRAEGELETIEPDDVFRCDDIVVRALDGGTDYAILRLDRPVPPERRPAQLRPPSLPLAADDPVTIIGFGSGLPAKIDNGGSVVNPRIEQGDYFNATNDAFGGNSGSGVFDEERRVVGILVRGATDYTTRDGCTIVNRLPERSDEGGDFGEDVVYAARAVEALCEVEPDNGLCGGEFAWCLGCENDEQCPDDFICRAPGEGLVAACTKECVANEDCRGDHSCIEGVCTPGSLERCELNDVWSFDTCGRRVGVTTECDAVSELCIDAACAEAGPGNSCASAISVEAIDQTLSLTFDETYNSVATGSCAGAGPEAFWQFELTDPAAFAAVASGDDPVLYLRSACESPDSEIICNDDIERGEDNRSSIRADLEPGTYWLVLDSYRAGAAGEFTVELDFEQACECTAGDIICDGDGLLICAGTSSACPTFSARRRCPSGRVCSAGNCVESADSDTCANAVDVELDTPVFGDLSGNFGNTVVGSCGGEGRDAFHTLTIERAGTIRATAEGAGVVVSLRDGCDDESTEFDCEAAATPSTSSALSIEVDVEPGQYFVAVDSLDATGGQYSLYVSYITGCIDECNTVGASQCVGGNAARECGDADGNGCREWGERVPCAEDEVCTAATGACVGPDDDAGVDAGGSDDADESDSAGGDAGTDGSGLVIIDTETRRKQGCNAAAPVLSYPLLLLVAALLRRRRR